MSDLDEIVKKALDERRALRTRLDEVDAFLENTRRYNGGMLPIVDAANEITGRAHERLTFYAQRRVKTNHVVNAAKEVLREVGRPMTRFELAEALMKRDVNVGGSDKAKNIGTILWRSPEIESTGDGYWPKGDPLPSAPKRAV